VGFSSHEGEPQHADLLVRGIDANLAACVEAAVLYT
jgi:hypothetical protein